MAYTNARNAGLIEGMVAPGSGLAYRQFRHYLVGAQGQVVNVRPVGGVGSAAVSAWTSLTQLNKLIPYGATLCANVVQATPAASTFRLRVKGYDQFHEYVEEVTPTVTLASKTNNFIYLAKPFLQVEKVEYMSTGLDIAGDTLSLGPRWDWVRTNDATNEHIAGPNLGVPLMLRSGRRIGPTTRNAFNFTQRVGPVRVATDRDPLEILGCTFHDMTGAGFPVVPIANDNIRVGQNEAGWIGSPDKIHFLAAAVTLWANTDEIQLVYQMLSAENMT